MKNTRRSNALRRYLRLLEAYCPDTLHVWMPKFDGKRTSSATYDLVSGTALNLGSGAAFSGDGKWMVLESGEIATAGVTTRSHPYIALVMKIATPSSTETPLEFDGGLHVQIGYFTNGSTYWGCDCNPSEDGSSYNTDKRTKIYFPLSPQSFFVVEYVCNMSEVIMRSPQESSHQDNEGASLAAGDKTMQLHRTSRTTTIEVAAAIYGGATTSAPLESLASVVKSGESGSLLTEMFRELIT